MSRLLVIPAAGLGSRLGAAVPKVLVPVAGVPMIDRLLALYRSAVDDVVIITNPAFAGQVEQHVRSGPDAPRVSCEIQESPTGMLDAILLASGSVTATRPSSIWITWCDQVAIRPRTIERLVQWTGSADAAPVVMPTAMCANPYIHLERGSTGRITRVLQRREGDIMPEIGESDVGLFALSTTAFLELLPAFSSAAAPGSATRERNFLPFLPWVAARARVMTFPCEDPLEAVGVNTPEDLALVEAYLDRG